MSDAEREDCQEKARIEKVTQSQLVRLAVAAYQPRAVSEASPDEIPGGE